VPDSHLKTWRYRKTNKGGFIKPELDEDPTTIPGVLVPTEPGTLLIFNEGTLHGGAVNKGDLSRVSMEITMVFQ
jgi:ectoine hydroxylase-related dioxygenase (phytanoyl-CoA dioxygenase family)